MTTCNLIDSTTVSEKSKASIFRVEELHSITNIGGQQAVRRPNARRETHTMYAWMLQGL
jgi:hypothetical protein